MNGTEKKYLNGIQIHEKRFDNGNYLLNVSIDKDKFIESVNNLEGSRFSEIVIVRRKKPGKFGETHTCYERDRNKHD